MRTRHINRNRKLRKESRRIPIPGHRDYGEGRDANRYFKCWRCKFICDVERDALGGAADRKSVSVIPYSQVDEYGNAATAGAIITTTTRYRTEVDMGCPLCGTLNWRGDY